MQIYSTIWILTVESRGARIFASSGREEPVLVKIITHPKGREQDVAFNSDRPGRRRVPIGGSRHALSAPVSPHEEENKKFIHQVVDFLKVSYERHQFERLVVVAPPALLGRLRRLLPTSLKKILLQEVAKELPFYTTETAARAYLTSKLVY